MNKLNKNYLVIHNVNQDKNLKQYLEQICSDEKVNILHEEFNQFDIWNQKQSVYAEFDAKPSFDILLWSYDENKLNYINYLYNKFDKEYAKAKKYIINVLTDNNEEKDLDEGEKVDIAIRDDLSSGWTVQRYNYTQVKPEIKENAENFARSFTEYLNYDLSKDQKDILRKSLGAWATGDWKMEEPKNKPILKQKVSNFYNKHVEKIMYLICGIALSNVYFITILTLKHFMVK